MPNEVHGVHPLSKLSVQIVCSNNYVSAQAEMLQAMGEDSDHGQGPQAQGEASTTQQFYLCKEIWNR